jgi:hypothetical protein
MYKQQAQDIKHVFKCRRVTPEGVVYGVFGIVKNKLLFYQIVNSPEQKIL